MNEKAKSHRRLSYLIFFVIVFLFNLFIDAAYGDDILYSNILQERGLNLLEFSILHYNEWSARTLVEAVLVIVSGLNIFVFRLINSALISAVAISISKFFPNSNNAHGFIMAAALVFSYSWYDLQSAGYVTTFIVMFWPFAVCMLALLTYVNDINGIANKKYIYPLTTVAIIWGTNLELMQPFMIIILLCFSAVIFIKNKKLHVTYYINLIFVFINLVYALTAPGTKVRSEMNIAGYFIDYEMYPFILKVQKGVYELLLSKLTTINLPLICLSVFILAAIFIKHKNIWLRLFAAANFIITSTLTLSPLNASLNAKILGFFNLSRQINVSNQNSLLTYIPFILLCFNLLFLIIGIYLSLGHTKKSFLVLSFFISGFLSGASLGFTPGIAVSGARTYVAFAFAIIIAAYAIFDDIYSLLPPKGRKAIYCFALLIVVWQTYILAESYLYPIYA